MSAQVCPVCGGKGLVPNGFYDVGSTNLGGTHKTTSATPETCRSCKGKGYIIEFPDYYSFPKYTCNGIFYASNHSCDRFDGNTTLQDVIYTSDETNSNYTIIDKDALNTKPTSDNTIKVENEEFTGTSDYSNMVICTTDENGKFPDVSKYLDKNCLIICNSLVNDKRYFYSYLAEGWCQLD